MKSFLKLSRRFRSLLVPLALLAFSGEAAALTVGGVTVDVVATQSWGAGFNGVVRVTNDTYPSAITSFQVVFKLNGTAAIQGNGWNGTISSPDASGNRTARNAAWMQFSNVTQGRSWEEGFSGTGAFSGATIVSVTINGQSGPGDDTTAPTVSLASTATSVTTQQTITLTAAATDNVGVTRVEFYDGAALVGTDMTAPYTWQISLSAANDGTHAYTARATDAAGNTGTSAPVSVVVNVAPGGDTTPPTVSLASSATRVTTGQTVTLTGTATDNVGVTRVEFYDGTLLIGSDPSAPYTATVSFAGASPGTRAYTARAYDAAGNSRTSAAVTVTVTVLTDTVPPTVSLVSSAASVTTAGPLTLTATASDDVGVTRVEFSDGATLLGSDTSAPYTAAVSLTAANNGTRSFTAKAFDAAGNSATSTAVVVTVSISQGGGDAPVYTAAGGKFLKDGVELKLFGLNWFGMETPDRVLHGLWTGRQLDDFLADFKSKGFNALRLPLSPQVINPGFLIDSGPYSGNDCAAMCGKDGRTGLEYVLKRMEAAGMYALLDFHTCNPAQLGSGLPGSPVNCSGYSLASWIADLETLAQLSKTHPNVIGIDLTNEPHQLTWAAWADYSSLGGQAVLAVNPNTTVWVEGIGNASTAGVSGGANWGQNLYEAGAIADVPSSKLVYTPHSYGPSVAAMSYFSDPTFPANMPALWDTMFGHLVGKGYTVVLGEYGGMYTGADKTWQDAFVSYLVSRNIKSSFYWCVNPNSGDTGGVLQGDWKSWNDDKVRLLQRLMQ